MSDQEGMQFPAPVYRETVLRQVFADAQRLFLKPMIDVHLAHVLMLAQQDIVPADCAGRCLHAICHLDLAALAVFVYDGTVEDLFFLVERELAMVLGAEDAGRIHTARSRNDLDMTMYRMVLRDRLLRAATCNTALRGVLIRLVAEHRDAVMPAYTHNQPAQPTTLGHFLMAYVEVLERDHERLVACFPRVNRSPLGACAITTTGFPIDRHATAEALGFRGLVVNSYGAIAAVDYLSEACGVLSTSMLSLGRFTQEMLLWSTAEFGFLCLSDAYVQISSIMPQKRNPVALEHVRVLASRSMTEAQGVLTALHNTPFADMNDGEDTLQPLVELAFVDADRATTLMTGILEGVTFNTVQMRQRASRAFLTVTELADTLVREIDMPFQSAHAIVSAAVHRAADDDPHTLAQSMQQTLTNNGMHVDIGVLMQALDPEHFVAVRHVTGGPAPAALQVELTRATAQLQTDRMFSEVEQRSLAEARSVLFQRARTFAATVSAGTADSPHFH